MRYLSICSGIEAASCAWKSLGWQAVAYSEIEPFPCAVLKHHFPDTPNWGDMTKWKDWPRETIDLLVGGTPCQSFSTAGLRKGLDDIRGQLALGFSSIAEHSRPRWIVWENVPGVLSSGGGRDFGSFIQSLVKLGYGLSWRVLDAQHFGVPQRRRRVFVVGYLGDWRTSAAVLFEPESLRRNSKAGGKKPKGDTDTIETGIGGSDKPSIVWSGSDQVNAERVVDKAGTLNCNQGQRGGWIANVNGWPARIAPTLDASFGQKQGLDNQHIINNYGSFFVPNNPAWIPCPDDCGDFWCNIHKQHTGDCDCPPIEEWETGPYGMQLNGPKYFQVRRLTPLECERLQGFPDGWTDIPYRGKSAPDGPRYKAIGNSMAVPVMRWIGQRIQMVEELMNVNK